MSDGREEREVEQTRVEQQKREGREDLVDPDDIANDWEPERVDS